MRSHFKLLFFITLLLVSEGRAAGAENPLRGEVLPNVVKQGDVCLIRVSGAASWKSIHGEFQGEKIPLAFVGPNKAYGGLIGVDLSTRPDTYKVKVVTTDGGGRVDSHTLWLRVERADFKTQKLSLPSSMVDLDPETLERANQEEKRLVALFRGFREERLWSGAFRLPVTGELTGVFGTRRVINGQPKSPHTGVDLKAEEGTPVLACNHGIAGLVDQLFFTGKSVILDHGGGLFSMYFHLSEVLIQEGDRVNKGAMLGRVGSTGRSTGPHLHWGIRVKGARVDPFSFLTLTQYLGE